jgi:hypothetical protein
MTQPTNTFFTISSISKWTSEKEAIVLPKLQRGFVWKPMQIAHLWDSILRGYPIGCFMMAVNPSDNTKELLDGQQRASSILAGFYNPFSGDNMRIFSMKSIPTIWIDLCGRKPFESKYSIHILTQSHPWGYRADDPSKILIEGDRREAFKHLQSISNCSNYLDLESKHYIPWDSVCPIPLCFLLELSESECVNVFKEALLEKLSRLSVRTKHHCEDIDYCKTLETYKFEDLFEAIKYAKQLVIPELKINIQLVDGGLAESRDPTLFERLNAGGTRISGEELVYSIFKANFPQCKELVEQISVAYIAPSKLINVFARLAEVFTKNGEGNIAYRKRIDIDSFKNLLKDDRFKSELEQLIQSTDGAQQQFSLLVELFAIDDQLPKLLVKNILANNTDLVFTILAFLHTRNVKTNEDLIREDIRKVLLKAIFHISWFSIDKAKAVSRLFALLINQDCYKSYSLREDLFNALNTLVDENHLFPLVPPEILQRIFEVIADRKINFWDDRFIDYVRDLHGLEGYFDVEADADRLKFRTLIDRIRYNKELLLLAQRKYVTSEFQAYNQFETLEDTNRPWDWDHIFPSNWVRNRKAIHGLVKQWNGAIGNLRALSMASNRSEKDEVSPKDRLGSLKVREDSFIDCDDYGKYWAKFDQSDFRLVNDSDELLFVYLQANLNRTRKIYEEFFNIVVKPTEDTHPVPSVELMGEATS